MPEANKQFLKKILQGTWRTPRGVFSSEQTFGLESNIDFELTQSTEAFGRNNSLESLTRKL